MLYIAKRGIPKETLESLHKNIDKMIFKKERNREDLYE